MKILHTITTIERGGAEHQLLTLVKKQIENNDKIVVAFLKGKPELQSNLESIGAEVLKLTSYSLVRQIFILRKYAKKGFDIIHAHLPRSELLVYFAILNLDIKYVISRHNAEKFFPSSHFYISRLLSRMVSRRADAVIAISNAVSTFLILHKEVNISKKIYTVHYGFDFETRHKVKSVDNTLKILFLGRLEFQKDLPTLLKALEKIKSKINVSLTVAGSGSLECELKKYADELKVSELISWLGKVDKVGSLMESHDLMILPSKYEGFGLVLLEAINFKIPVLATKITSIPEVLGDDYIGLFKVGDYLTLAELITKFNHSSKFRSKLLNQLSARKPLFSSNIMQISIKKLYEEILKN